MKKYGFISFLIYLLIMLCFVFNPSLFIQKTLLNTFIIYSSLSVVVAIVLCSVILLIRIFRKKKTSLWLLPILIFLTSSMVFSNYLLTRDTNNEFEEIAAHFNQDESLILQESNSYLNEYMKEYKKEHNLVFEGLIEENVLLADLIFGDNDHELITRHEYTVKTIHDDTEITTDLIFELSPTLKEKNNKKYVEFEVSDVYSNEDILDL